MAALRQLGLAIFSAWAWGGGFAWMLVGATLTLLLRAIGFPYQRIHNWVTAPMFVHVVTFFSAARVRIHYHPEFDRTRRSVFTQNHINLLDGHLASAVIPHAFSGLMNAWQFHIPIYGWLMRLSKGIAVDKRRRDRLVEQLTQAARERKRIGMSILTFPEGHRTLDGKVHGYRRGVFIMARNAEMPVVPIAVRGFYEVNRKGSLVIHPWRRVDVFVGPQHDTAGLDDEGVAALASKLHTLTAHAVEHGEWPDSFDARHRSVD